jgi:hypothetical protein
MRGYRRAREEESSDAERHRPARRVRLDIPTSDGDNSEPEGAPTSDSEDSDNEDMPAASIRAPIINRAYVEIKSSRLLAEEQREAEERKAAVQRRDLALQTFMAALRSAWANQTLGATLLPLWLRASKMRTKEDDLDDVWALASALYDVAGEELPVPDEVFVAVLGLLQCRIAP